MNPDAAAAAADRLVARERRDQRDLADLAAIMESGDPDDLHGLAEWTARQAAPWLD